MRGDWWGQPGYGGITLENNVFGHSINGSGWHYYGVYFASRHVQNIRVVNNTFENNVIFDANNRGRPVLGRVGQQHRRRLVAASQA